MKLIGAFGTRQPWFALLLLASLLAEAAEYPSKPVKIIVPFAVGGTGDIVARIIALSMGKDTGAAFIVENRTGAGGRIGYEAGARSPGDGYTFVATDATYTMLPGLYGKLNWDQANDLVPVTISAQAPFVVIVGPDTKAKTLPDLLAYAKANPGKITYGSAGIGSVNHIVTELLKREAGIDITHVPYKGMGEAMTGLLSGTVDMIITALPTAIPHIKSGKAVPLAVTLVPTAPKITVAAPKTSVENRYVQGVLLDGVPMIGSEIGHSDIVGGSILTFDMGPKPKLDTSQDRHEN